ncbi:MAG: hypothetical protein RMX68_003875 [Aulosira sp. ZfuVER01]|nr:hypothetical protein [Aulosira sp. ZfuVER01]MDZ7999935.1 hypothetical protein [Aulosira sp. DedVER01a]MDZ8051373.1 hypothetical protein [Aulosira sp. ZfuCHP01]
MKYNQIASLFGITLVFFGILNLSILSSAYSSLNAPNVQKLPEFQAVDNSITAISIRNSRSSSDYQENAISLSADNLSHPHILSINTSGSQLQGKIIFNGKVIKQIRGKSAYINLSPYLSVGEYTVKIVARYYPTSSSVNVELTGPGIDVTQATSGNGVLNYTLNVSVY